MSVLLSERDYRLPPDVVRPVETGVILVEGINPDFCLRVASDLEEAGDWEKMLKADALEYVLGPHGLPDSFRSLEAEIQRVFFPGVTISVDIRKHLLGQDLPSHIDPKEALPAVGVNLQGSARYKGKGIDWTLTPGDIVILTDPNFYHQITDISPDTPRIAALFHPPFILRP